MSSPVALDTSVAVPLLVATHRSHAEVTRWCRDRALALSGHALAETYSVLTRLPGEARLAPEDAARLIDARFEPALILGADLALRLPKILADLDIAGGAVYDAMVALAAAEHQSMLATRDARAMNTYEAIGVKVQVVG